MTIEQIGDILENKMKEHRKVKGKDKDFILKKAQEIANSLEEEYLKGIITISYHDDPLFGNDRVIFTYQYNGFQCSDDVHYGNFLEYSNEIIEKWIRDDIISDCIDCFVKKK